MKGWKRIFHANEKTKKQVDIIILVSDNIDFNMRSIGRDENGYHIMIKGSIQQDEIMIINICTSNSRAPNSMK